MMPPKKNGSAVRIRKQPEKNTDDYLRKRERNNEAVKKSREKARQKQKETQKMVEKLRSENVDLERKVKLLTKELDVLKDLFLSQAAAGRQAEEEYVPIKTELKTEGQLNKQDLCQSALHDHEYCS